MLLRPSGELRLPYWTGLYLLLSPCCQTAVGERDADEPQPCYPDAQVRAGGRKRRENFVSQPIVQRQRDASSVCFGPLAATVQHGPRRMRAQKAPGSEPVAHRPSQNVRPGQPVVPSRQRWRCLRAPRGAVPHLHSSTTKECGNESASKASVTLTLSAVRCRRPSSAITTITTTPYAYRY